MEIVGFASLGWIYFKQKIKLIKENLKECRKKHITNLDDKLVGTKKIVNELERKEKPQHYRIRRLIQKGRL